MCSAPPSRPLSPRTLRFSSCLCVTRYRFSAQILLRLLLSGTAPSFFSHPASSLTYEPTCLICCQHTSAYVSIRQHTSTYVCIGQILHTRERRAERERKQEREKEKERGRLATYTASECEREAARVFVIPGAHLSTYTLALATSSLRD